MAGPVPLDWSTLRDFLTVAEVGSLSGAARLLGVSQPTLTRRMAALEERLHAELFQRTPRGLELTQAGEAILEPARQMAQDAAAVELAVGGGDGALAGSVRITATEGIGIDWLTPILADFQGQHPAIELELLIRNRSLNLLRREADIAVRLGRPRQTDLVARRVGDLALGLYASPGYLDARGRPRSDEDLRHHQGVGWDEAMVHSGIGLWTEQGLGPAHVVYRADSLQAQRAAMRAGYGIGTAALLFGESDPDLERVLPERSFKVGIWLVTHPGLRRSARIRAVFDFLVERFDVEAARFAGTSTGAPR